VCSSDLTLVDLAEGQQEDCIDAQKGRVREALELIAKHGSEGKVKMRKLKVREPESGFGSLDSLLQPLTFRLYAAFFR
jgi:hypothetical protein